MAQNAFWSGYNDRTLNGLISTGMGQSLDIMAANERIRAAEADLRATGVLASQVTGSSVVGRERTGGDGLGAATANSANLSASLVFDLFGKARRAQEGATASYRSAEAQAETVRLVEEELARGVLTEFPTGARFLSGAVGLTRKQVVPPPELKALEEIALQIAAGETRGIDACQVISSKIGPED